MLNDPERLRADLMLSLEEMANTCSVPMEIWNRHSNLVMDAVSTLARVPTEASVKLTYLEGYRDARPSAQTSEEQEAWGKSLARVWAS